MRKIVLVLLAALMLGGCSDNGDDKDSLPYTDTTVFEKNGGFYFPEKTSALELFSALYKKYGEGTFNISGLYIKTETAVLNGNEYKDVQRKEITELNIYKSESEAHSHQFHADLSCSDGTKLNFCYAWQYHNYNVWNNNKSDGEIIITF